MTGQHFANKEVHSLHNQGCVDYASMIRAFVEHNQYSFGAVQQSIIGRFLSIILPLLYVIQW